MSDYISFFDFLEQTEYIFTGFISVIGMENKETGKIFLKDDPTLRNYKNKYKKAESIDDKRPSLKDNHRKIFLNKCKYYLYPDKRESEYTLKNGDRVESIEIFSAKCVTLFFQITEINFSFLRINPDYSNQKFVLRQKQCLIDLFDSLFTLFMKSTSEEKRLIEKNGELQAEKVNDFKFKNVVPMNEFLKWVKYLYIKYRYKLSQIDPEHLIRFSPILPNENVELLKYNQYANTQLCKLIFLPGKNYNLYRNNINVESEFDFTKFLNVLKDIGFGLNAIDTADNIEDVTGVLIVLFNLKYWYINDKKIEVEKFRTKPPKDWKNKCVQYLISYNTSKELRVPNHDIFNEYEFVRCIIYHNTNICDENCEYIDECDKKKDCEFKKSCRALSTAKNTINSLRKAIWKFIKTKGPYEIPDELYELIEVIERICLFYFD